MEKFPKGDFLVGVDQVGAWVVGSWENGHSSPRVPCAAREHGAPHTNE